MGSASNFGLVSRKIDKNQAPHCINLRPNDQNLRLMTQIMICWIWSKSMNQRQPSEWTYILWFRTLTPSNFTSFSCLSNSLRLFWKFVWKHLICHWEGVRETNSNVTCYCSYNWLMKMWSFWNVYDLFSFKIQHKCWAFVIDYNDIRYAKIICN